MVHLTCTCARVDVSSFLISRTGRQIALKFGVWFRDSLDRLFRHGNAFPCLENGWTHCTEFRVWLGPSVLGTRIEHICTRAPEHPFHILVADGRLVLKFGV